MARACAARGRRPKPSASPRPGGGRCYVACAQALPTARPEQLRLPGKPARFRRAAIVPRSPARGGVRLSTRRMTVPKSRVRSKAVYTPPPRSTKAKVSPRWLAPTMVGCLLLGLAWIALFYVTEGSTPVQQPLGDWNLVLGFGFIIASVMLASRWQ